MEQKAILLVEDDFLNRRVTKKTLSENNYQVYEAKNAREALEVLKKDIIDLVILDINLGKEEVSGVTLGLQLHQEFSVPFIYLTAFDSGAVIQEALATVPYSYLTKPFKDVDLITSIEIAMKQSGKKSIPKLSVKDGEYQVELPINEIDYIESEGNYVIVYAGKKVFKSRSTIKQIAEALPEKEFAQVHRAFVVNRSKVKKYNLRSLYINETEIPLSKNFYDSLLGH